jgi:leader peptidase (prepilin peptidase)/N-methyltransferase
MGDGDAKLMAMLGSFLGWKLVMLAFFIAPFMGLPHAIMVKLKKGERAIPYGPYLSLGAIIALLYGDKVLKFIFWGM